MIRVLRVLEYTFPDLEAYERHKAMTKAGLPRTDNGLAMTSAWFDPQEIPDA